METNHSKKTEQKERRCKEIVGKKRRKNEKDDRKNCSEYEKKYERANLKHLKSVSLYFSNLSYL